MLTWVISIIGIFLTLFLIISIHEFGHFLFARLLGVKVLQFSIGFGKPFYCWHDRKGTKYTLAPILLGGYVKLLDETEGEVSENELSFAYNRQPIYKRFLIALAGPFFNLLFAFFLYWLLFIIGFTTIIPIVGKILPHSIAEKAGMKSSQEIISINHIPTPTWMSATIKILTQAGETGKMLIEVKEPNTHQIKLLSLYLTHWYLDELKPQPLESLGIIPHEPFIPAVIQTIQPNSDAFLKLMKGDKIISVNHQAIRDWHGLVDIITQSPNKTLSFAIQRNKKIIHTQIKVSVKHDFLFHQYGFLGISPQFTWPKDLLRKQQYGPIDSLSHAWNETYTLTQLNFIIIGKMLAGKISIKSLGGPITIFESAGAALNQGIPTFFGFLAFLSVAIGIINILPIPGLDGGHVLLQVIELIICRPIPLRLQLLFYKLGFALLLLILIQSLANDFLRM